MHPFDLDVFLLLYAKNKISVETVKNSWRHGEYSWFPNEEDNDNNNEEDDNNNKG